MATSEYETGYEDGFAHGRRIAARDHNIMLAALVEAVGLIDSLSDQQAMPDDFYVEPLAFLRALAENVEPMKEE